MTKKIRKALLLVACFALTIALSIGGTIAWLQNETDPVTNTFSVGSVGFDETLDNGLDEAEVDKYGDPIVDSVKEGATEETVDETLTQEGYLDPTDTDYLNPNVDRVTENYYKLVPGETYLKDPTIHLAENNEPAYVFVQVKNPIAPIEDETTIENQMIANGWIRTSIENVWVYKDIVHTLTTDAGAEDTGSVEAELADVAQYVAKNTTSNKFDMVVFEEFTLVDDANVDAYKDAKIEVKAFIIQAKGFYVYDESYTGSYDEAVESGIGDAALYEAAHLKCAEAAWREAGFDTL